MANRIVTGYERAVTTTVNDIEHIESQSLRGISVVKVFFQPGAASMPAVAQVTAIAQTVAATRCRRARRRRSSSRTTPRACRSCSSRCPGQGLSEQQLYDLGNNFLRTQLATVAGRRDAVSVRRQAARRSRSTSIPQALQAKGLAPNDVVNAINAQNLILPAGTAKIGDVRIRRRAQQQPDDGRGAERPADQDRRRQRRSTSATSRTSATATRRRPTSSASNGQRAVAADRS